MPTHYLHKKEDSFLRNDCSGRFLSAIFEKHSLAECDESYNYSDQYVSREQMVVTRRRMLDV